MNNAGARRRRGKPKSDRVAALMRETGKKTPADAMLHCVHKLRADLGRPHSPIDVFSLAESFDITVNLVPLENPGLLIQRSDGSFEIRIDSSMRPERQRFTAAHELGHFLLFRHVPEEMARSRADDYDDEEEYLCNIAAAEMLMPMMCMRAAVRMNGVNPESIFSLASEYGVSVQAVMRSLRVALRCEVYCDVTFVVWRVDCYGRLVPEWQVPTTPPLGPLSSDISTKVASQLATNERAEGRHLFVIDHAQQLRRYKIWRFDRRSRLLGALWNRDAPKLERYLW